MRRFLQWLWEFLPDRCQVIDCERRGIRGNENNVGGKIVCDYCYSRQGHLQFGHRRGFGLRAAAHLGLIGLFICLLILAIFRHIN